MSTVHVMEGVVGLQRVHIPHFQVSKSGFSDFGELGFVLRYFGLHLARTSLPCRVCSETVALAQ